MLNVLGVLGMILYIALLIALAAGITWLVVRFSPSKKPGQT